MSLVPGGVISRNNLDIALIDPVAKCHSLYGLYDAFEFLGGETGIEATIPSMNLAFGGTNYCCNFQRVNVGSSLVVVELPHTPGSTTYMVVRVAPEALSSRLLTLPANDPEEWGEGNDAVDERGWRILRFVCLVLQRDWWL